jgi:hypothetical protein
MRGLRNILLIVFSPILLMLIGLATAIFADVAENFWGLAATLCLGVITLSVALLVDLRELNNRQPSRPAAAVPDDLPGSGNLP